MWLIFAGLFERDRTLLAGELLGLRASICLALLRRVAAGASMDCLRARLTGLLDRLIPARFVTRPDATRLGDFASSLAGLFEVARGAFFAGDLPRPRAELGRTGSSGSIE